MANRFSTAATRKNPGSLAGETGAVQSVRHHHEAFTHYTKLRSSFNDDGHFCGLEVVR